MALTETRPETLEEGGAVEAPVELSAIERAIGTADHLAVGRLFIGFSLAMLGVSAAGLVASGLDGLSSDGLFGLSVAFPTSSLVGLVVAGVMPLLLGVAYCIVPLQVGSPSLSFPRAAALSMWAWLISTVIFFISVAMDGGIGGADLEAARLGSIALGAMLASLGLASVCVATTVLTHRPLTMRLPRVPLFSWSMLVASTIWIVSIGSAFAHVVLGYVGKYNAAGLAEAFDGGIAWFFRAPSVYMIAIPLLGIAGDAVAKAAGVRFVRYGFVQGLIAGFGVLSFGAWAQTPRSLQTVLWVLFVMLAAIPVLGLIGEVAASLRRGRVSGDPAVIGVLVGLLVLLLAVLAGAAQAIDTTGTGTLFGLDVALIESAQTMLAVTAGALGAVAALSLWSRRIWGTPTAGGAELGAVAAVLVGGVLAGVVYLVQGVARADGGAGLSSEFVNAVLAVGAGVFLLGVMAQLLAVFGAATADEIASDDESGLTLEWRTYTVRSDGAFEEDLPVVATPYPLLDERTASDDKEGV